jgi:5,6,7,8-tetrahydromethanopterin hydro-lyase
MSVMFVGEGLYLEDNDLANVAHIDLLIGPKDGPVGVAFANALSRQSEGHTNLLAVVTPNLVCKPATVMITKVTIKGSKQVLQMFGPAQAAVARAVTDSVIDGTIPKAKAEDYVIVCGVFIDAKANDNKKIYKFNYEATKLAIKNAMKQTPTIDEIIAKKETKHPFE